MTRYRKHAGEPQPASKHKPQVQRISRRVPPIKCAGAVSSEESRLPNSATFGVCPRIVDQTKSPRSLQQPNRRRGGPLTPVRCATLIDAASGHRRWPTSSPRIGDPITAAECCGLVTVVHRRTGAANSPSRTTSEVAAGTSSRAGNSTAVKTTKIITATIALEVVIHAKRVNRTPSMPRQPAFSIQSEAILFLPQYFLTLSRARDTPPRLCVGLQSAEQMRCTSVSAAVSTRNREPRQS